MNRDAFLQELAYLLSDLPEEERQEAINYYRDYIEDAGSEHEEEVLSQLDSPARVAALIRAGMNGEERGEYTEHGYEEPGYRETTGEVVESRRRAHSSHRTQSQRACHGSAERSEYGGQNDHRPRDRTEDRPDKNRRGLKIVLLVILVILASPMLFGLGSGALGVVAGFFALLFGLVCGLGGLTLGFLVGGVVSLVVGIVRICTFSPFSGVAAVGAGVALLGVGILCLALCVLFYGTFLPWLFRGITGACRSLFRGFRKGGSRE